MSHLCVTNSIVYNPRKTVDNQICKALILFSWDSYQHQLVISLNAAIQRFIPFGRSISRDLLIAKERIPNTPANGLNTDESAAIYMYTMEKHQWTHHFMSV